MSTSYTVPSLGQVTIEDIIVQYDGPRLFSVIAENGGRFVALLVDQDAYRSVYWYSAASEDRYRSLLRGELDVRSLFSAPETGVVLEAVTTVGEEDAAARWDLIPPERLEGDRFPLEGYKLRPAPREAVVAERGTILAAAAAMRRMVARISFGFERHEAPTGVVSLALSRLQDTIDAIGQYVLERPTERGIIPDRVTSKTGLSFIATYAGSFGVELAAEEQSDLFGESTVSRCFLKLLELLKMGDDTESLREAFSQLKGRTAKRYRSLLQSLSEAETDVAFDVAEPGPNPPSSVVLREADIAKMISALYLADREQTEFEEFDADLVGYNRRTRSFEILDILKQRKYSGKVTGPAVEAAKRAKIGDIYSVKIATTTEFVPAIETEVTKYELFDMQPTGKRARVDGDSTDQSGQR